MKQRSASSSSIIFNIYKNLLSPTLAAFFKGGCRFEPTCSVYCDQAIKKYGSTKGVYLSIIRVLRCNPLSKHPHNYPV